MSLIKFPSHIKPARVSVQLLRVQETNASPLTNIQQVAARGNPAWQWRYEFADLSDSERDVVQSFLLKCKGALNTFKVIDPGDYEIRGSVSNWIDIFSGYGSFNVVAGSESTKVNSWFSKSAQFAHNISDEQILNFEWRTRSDATNLRWTAETGIPGKVTNFELGKAYVQRIKHFPYDGDSLHSFSFIVGSDAGGPEVVQLAPVKVFSADCVTAPFIIGSTVSSYNVGVKDWVNEVGSGGLIGTSFNYADYRLARCALISNSENLLTRSNEFDHADWTATNANVASGYSDASPTGVTSGGWKFFMDSSVNTSHQLSQSITKNASEDMYTASITARESELSLMRLDLFDGNAGVSRATFDLNAGSNYLNTLSAAFVRPFAKMFDVGSGYWKCTHSAIVSSLTNLTARLYLVSSTNGYLQSTGNGSDGIEIFGAQLRQHPFAGHYVPTVAAAVVGTSQTGSKLYVEGLDPNDKLKAGTRFEVVNRFHNNSSDLFERSEFKRVTDEVVVHREGWAILSFDPPIRNASVTDRSYRVDTHLGETMHNPVIFSNPELKARLLAGTIQYTEKPLKTTDISFDVMEDMTE